MLKLVIVDDEKIIRETIRNFINWESIGIEVVGVCSNGVEAYETILDYYPDIVLADIKMPGFSGLELISKIKEIDYNIQFIILSGYDSFEYAKEAMRFGVQYYLLKPCNEHQIIDAVNAVKKDCYKQRSLLAMQRQQKDNAKKLAQNVIKNLIFECISSESCILSLIKNYEQILDFSYTEYKLYYIYYLEERHLRDCLQQLFAYFEKNFSSLSIHTIYVKNTLIFFFMDCALPYESLNQYIQCLCFKNQSVPIEFKAYSYLNLGILLDALIPKLKRYEQINLIEDFHSIQLMNHSAFLEKTEACIACIFQDNTNDSAILKLYELLASIKDIAFLKVLTTDMFFRFLTISHHAFINSEQINSYIENIDHYKNARDLIQYFFDQMEGILQIGKRNTSSSRDFISKVISLVDEQLSNPNLSLKWIAENHLYMNVDYLSKQFIKQMGVKFSTYLASKRIEKAKELLLNGHDEKISEIAKQIGCGDNPQYFSQLFKKYTGMTPSAFIKR